MYLKLAEHVLAAHEDNRKLVVEGRTVYGKNKEFI
ncbi:hypothetical protein COPEUT_02545 [Coprococcus eutactus ATCC 27759]|nr:hypothetical protein COPEUT_02545 [Coprococcus eutactus ATCC 27759]